MGEVFDPWKVLGGLPESHAGRARYLAHADRSVFSTIRFGVVFIMAWWSGPSRMAFGKLKDVLARTDPGGQLELVVVDTDGCPDLYVCPEFAGDLHGWGEVAWVRDGQVVSTSGQGFHPESFEPQTVRLLAKGRGA